MWIEHHSNFVPRKERLWIAYVIFWSILLVSLAVSMYLGFTSSWPWYLERTSYKMYEAMLLSAVILLVFLVMAVQIRMKRLRQREESLRARITILENTGRDEIFASEVLQEIDKAETRGRRSWFSISPLILMILVLFFISIFALVELSTYLADSYKINTVLVLFAGSCSKIVIGIESIVLYRFVIY